MNFGGHDIVPSLNSFGGHCRQNGVKKPSFVHQGKHCSINKKKKEKKKVRPCELIENHVKN